MQYSYRDELYHHGIKGQRWGIRRFQNKDGTLTTAGRKHYSNNEDGSTGNKKPVNWKKAAKVGAVIAGTALVAYGAYKLNSEINKDLTEKYIKLGNQSLKTSRKLDEYGSVLMDLADRAKFISDPDLSNASRSYNLNAAENYRKMASEARDTGIAYIKRAQTGKYTAKEKYDAIKGMIRR